MTQQQSPLLLDIKQNALLYGGAVCVVFGLFYHYPKIFAVQAQKAEQQSKADEKGAWACAAIEGRHPILVDESGTPLTLKDGAKYYGASRLGDDMAPIPAGVVLRDLTGNAGVMKMGATGDVVFDFVGSCPTLAGTPGVTTMGTYYEGSK
jgi:hypothetical protein